MATTNSTESLYDKLGVSPNATQEEIKAAFIKKAKAYHPDTKKGNDPESEKKFIEIREAYEILRNPEKRRQYDFASNINTFTKQHSSTNTYPNFYSSSNTTYNSYYTREQQQYQKARENWKKYYNIRTGYPYNISQEKTNTHTSKNDINFFFWLLLALYLLLVLYQYFSKQKKRSELESLIGVPIQARKIGRQIPHFLRKQKLYRAISFQERQNQSQSQKQQSSVQRPNIKSSESHSSRPTKPDQNTHLSLQTLLKIYREDDNRPPSPPPPKPPPPPHLHSQTPSSRPESTV